MAHKNKGRVSVVVGGQYGSEAKGAICAYLCQNEFIDYAVRTGATNAGHTVVFNNVRYAMQQLPCGWVNPYTRLVLGPGALIDLEILRREIALIDAALPEHSVLDRLHIDPRAYIHRSEHRAMSEQSDRHHAMGATGKGCSEALVERIRGRGAVAALTADERFVTFEDVVSKLDWLPDDRALTDTEALLNDEYDHGAQIQLEGTQGQLLDLYLGPYPYTTHKQTGPAQWLLEAGLSPNVNLDVVMVIRTFPIRVAGNSGPLPDEISWPILAREINAKRFDEGMQHVVSESAIYAFEQAMRLQVSMHQYTIPFASNGLDQHTWGDRYTYRMALSELNKDALHIMGDEHLREIRKLFEMTTVTKKLRRVARLHAPSLRAATRQIRPTRIALTFLNYVFPERWYTADPLDSMVEESYLSQVEEMCGFGADNPHIHFVSRGPSPEHIVRV